MSNYCINCGSKGTLQAKETPEGQEAPFLEVGEFDGCNYSEEREVTILKCASCKHEMIDLAS